MQALHSTLATTLALPAAGDDFAALRLAIARWQQNCPAKIGPTLVEMFLDYFVPDCNAEPWGSQPRSKLFNEIVASPLTRGDARVQDQYRCAFACIETIDRVLENSASLDPQAGLQALDASLNALTRLKAELGDGQEPGLHLILTGGQGPEGFKPSTFAMKIDGVRRLVEAVRQLMTNAPMELGFSEHLSLARSGLTDLRQISRDLTDATLVGEPEYLAAGKFNVVTKARFRRDGDALETRVLKPLKLNYEGNIAEKNSGFDTSDRRLAARNLATRWVAEMLGVGSLAPEAQIALVNGQLTLAMPPAPGAQPFASLRKPHKIEGNARTVRTHEATLRVTGRPPEGYFIRGEHWFKREDAEVKIVRRMPLVDRPFRHTFKIGEADRRVKYVHAWERFDDGAEAGSPFEALQPSNARESRIMHNLQEQLIALQTLDVLCGQADRHIGNLFIAISSEQAIVTGIDNDASFGAVNFIKRYQKNVGAPCVMGARIFDSLMRLDAQSYGRTLYSLGLNDREIAAAEARLALLREHALGLEARKLVLSDFSQMLDMDGAPVTVSQYIMVSEGCSYIERICNMAAINALSGFELVAFDHA